MVYKFKNSFSEQELPLIENVRIKSLTFFKHQINVIVVIFVLWKFLPSTVDKTKSTGTGHTTNYVTSILLKIFSYCLLALATNF